MMLCLAINELARGNMPAFGTETGLSGFQYKEIEDARVNIQPHHPLVESSKL